MPTFSKRCIAIALIHVQLLVQLVSFILIEPNGLYSLVDTQTREAGSNNRINPLNDQTLDWSPNVRRVWLKENPSPRPPAKLLLTNFGWNHPDRAHGLTFSRSKRNRGLIEGVVNHPWFDPTAWQDSFSNTSALDPSIRYYVFLDVETCFETNWPEYGVSYEENCDKDWNRSVIPKQHTLCFRLQSCRYIQQAVNTRLFQSGVNATLVVFECRGNGHDAHYRHALDKNKVPLALATVSSTLQQLRDPPDMGLLPPGGKTVNLTLQQIKDIQTCHEDSRPLLLSFVGNFRHATRKQLATTHNGHDVLVIERGTLKKPNLPNYFNGTYQELLASSKFAATPRGDNRFSYRFTEVMSSGAIPVIHSDGWVLPFRQELVNWNECAVVIPEVDANHTLEYLANMTSQERCQRRKRCLEIYQKYMSCDEAIISGIIEGLERVAESRQGYWYSPDYYRGASG